MIHSDSDKRISIYSDNQSSKQAAGTKQQKEVLIDCVSICYNVSESRYQSDICTEAAAHADASKKHKNQRWTARQICCSLSSMVKAL